MGSCKDLLACFFRPFLFFLRARKDVTNAFPEASGSNIGHAGGGRADRCTVDAML